MKLEGKVAIVTGGAQGIGEGIVRCLAEEGTNIAIADIDEEKTKKIAEDVKAKGGKVLPIIADLTNDKEIKRTVQDTYRFFGKIDILVNNIGGSLEERRQVFRGFRVLASEGGPVLPSYMLFGSKVWDKYYKLNLKSHVMMSQAVTPYLIKQRGGNIINISSIAARMSVPEHMPYAAFKASDISITWSLAKALAPYDVTVNCICPGHVFTPLWEKSAAAMIVGVLKAKAKKHGSPEFVRNEKQDESNIEHMKPYDFWLKYVVVPNTPLGRDQTVEDIGRAVVFLVSEDAKNITGQVLHIDGGMVMR